MLCFIFITSRARIDLDHDFFDILTFGTAPTFKFVFFQECETSSTLSVQLLHSCFYFLCVRSLLPYGMWNNQSNIQVRIFAFACSQRSQPRSLKAYEDQIYKRVILVEPSKLPLFAFPAKNQLKRGAFSSLNVRLIIYSYLSSEKVVQCRLVSREEH